MEHLIIGAVDAAHVREYARSWELSTSTRARVCGWRQVADGDVPLHGLRSQPVAVRMFAPGEDDIAALIRIGGGGEGSAGNLELAQAGIGGLHAAVATLEKRLSAEGIVPRYANPPAALLQLLDLDLRQRALDRDGFPTPTYLPLARGGSHECYEVLRDRLRHHPHSRAVVRLRRCLGPTPTVVAWMGGRGIRAQANCRFSASGAVRAEVHSIDDESELRPLLGRLFELGAVVHEDWPCAEIGGRPFTLTLLASESRVALGEVGQGGVWRVRGAPPDNGVPRDLLAVRRQLPRDLYEKIEETSVRVGRVYWLAGVVVDVALSRRFDRFAVLDIDPFARMTTTLRDSIGWSASDHLVRRMRRMIEQNAQKAS